MGANASDTSGGLGWRLALVETLAFHEDTSLGDAAVPSGFHLNADVDLDEEQGALVVSIRIEAVPSEDATGDQAMASIEVACVFQFESLDTVRDGDDIVRIGRSQVLSAMGIALATTRGVLVGRARHPIFSRVVFPLLSPRDQFAELVHSPDKPWIKNDG